MHAMMEPERVGPLVDYIHNMKYAPRRVVHREALTAEIEQALAADDLEHWVERLNAAESRPGVRYEAAFVGCHGYDDLFPPALRQDRVRSQNNDPFAQDGPRRR